MSNKNNKKKNAFVVDESSIEKTSHSLKFVVCGKPKLWRRAGVSLHGNTHNRNKADQKLFYDAIVNSAIGNDFTFGDEELQLKMSFHIALKNNKIKAVQCQLVLFLFCFCFGSQF